MCGCAVEDTPSLDGASDKHGTESGASGDLELGCIEAVLSRGRGSGIDIGTTLSYNTDVGRYLGSARNVVWDLW